jgi:hypothetical protein
MKENPKYINEKQEVQLLYVKYEIKFHYILFSPVVAGNSIRLPGVYPLSIKKLYYLVVSSL